jgi:hypothetical protein
VEGVPELWCQLGVRELASFAGIALEPGVEVLARELGMHEEAFVFLGTTVHHVELAELQLSRGKRCMRKRTLRTLPKHIIHTNRITVVSTSEPSNQERLENGNYLKQCIIWIYKLKDVLKGRN